MDRRQTIIRTAERYGFNLEFKVQKILQDKEFHVEQNKSISHNSSNIEIDVVAREKNSYLHLLIECKGAAKDSALILIKSPDNIFKNCQFESNIYFSIKENDDYCIPKINLSETDAPFCSNTGDFFTGNGDCLKRCSKNSDKSNFYKAQQQILEAIKAYTNKIPTENEEGDSSTNFLIPIIVTNAEIWLVDYTEARPEATELQWAAQAICNTEPTNFNFLTTATNEDLDYLPMLVVRVDYLGKVLEPIQKVSRTCGILLKRGIRESPQESE